MEGRLGYKNKSSSHQTFKRRNIIMRKREIKFLLYGYQRQLVYFNNFHRILLLQYSPLPPRRDRLRIPLVARGPWKEDRPR